MVLRSWFRRAVLSRRWATFVVLGLAFFAFGAGTVNLVMLLAANLSLISEHGWQALMDGALRQLVELLLSGYLSMAAYIVFKACEAVLVRGLLAPPDSPTDPIAHEDRHPAR